MKITVTTVRKPETCIVELTELFDFKNAADLATFVKRNADFLSEQTFKDYENAPLELFWDDDGTGDKVFSVIIKKAR